MDQRLDAASIANAIAKAKPYTKSPLERLKEMAKALRYIDDAAIAGDIVETGVWKGGNIILARLLSPLRQCWACDTFEGMTEPDEQLDLKRSGWVAFTKYHKKRSTGQKWCDASLVEVQKTFAREGVDGPLVRYVVGDVCATLQDPANVPAQIALLRLDTDWHASTRAALIALYPRLAVGGVLIIDDYGHWLGCRKAVDDYLGEQTKYLRSIDYSAYVMVKT